MNKYGVVGAGLVGSLFEGLDDFEVVHHDEWLPMRWERGLVNCAAQSSRIACEQKHFSDVLQANVYLPQKMYESTLNFKGDVPFVQFSTTAIYKHPKNPDTVLDEDAAIYPLHSYGASKILMEDILADKECYIFRIPRVITDNGHPNDFGHHITRWTEVEDRHCSIVRGETIVNAVMAALENPNSPPGIYNIATEVIHLPSFIKENYGWEGKVIPADSMEGLGPWPIIDTSKAYRWGFIGDRR